MEKTRYFKNEANLQNLRFVYTIASKFKIKRLDYEKIVNSKQDLVDINYENLKQTDLFCFK